jgi:hypothetical protein
MRQFWIISRYSPKHFPKWPEENDEKCSACLHMESMMLSEGELKILVFRA